VKSNDHGAKAPERLRWLMADANRVTALRLWRFLEEEERADLAQTFMSAPATVGDKPNREKLVGVVATALNFRAATVRKWSDSKIADKTRGVPVRDSRFAIALIRHLFEASRWRPMAHRFAGLLGLAAPKDLVAATDVREETVRRAATALQEEYGQRKVVVHFLALVLHKAPMAESLRAWMREEAEAAPQSEAALPQETQDAPGAVEDAANEPGREETFTTLDRVLMWTIEDAKHGVEGALDEDEVDDMVDDYVNLNGRRRRSHFHAGFRDTLFERPVAAIAQDVRRARWYWAGAMQGWARSESWERIVQEYDKQELVRGLGDGSSASGAAVGQVVRALRERGRLDELATFVKSAAFPNPKLFKSLLDAATELLRNGDATRALPIFELLEQAAKKNHEADSFSNDQLVLNVRRRRAHCHRELERPTHARRILNGLLKLDVAPENRAMVNADLGLLEGGFRNLDDVQLPRRREALEGLKQQLEAGRALFERSVEDNVRYASHGHYCLGVLALCKEQYGQARVHFEQARDVIVGDMGHYRRELKARIALYLGIATILAVVDLPLGARRLQKGLDEGASFPPYLVKEAMEALDLGSKADLRRIAKLVLQKAESDDERTLDALAAVEPAIRHCEPLAHALLERACRTGRRKTEAAADLRKALRGFRHANSTDQALEALDRLEGYAFDGIDSEQFMELTKGDDDNYDCPPFEPNEARGAHARCLEADGKYEDAAIVLGEMFHRLASDGKVFDAEGVLAKIKELGDPASNYAVLERRLANLDPPAVREEKPRYDAARGVNILIVGGDEERQSKYDERVLKEVKRESDAIRVQFIRGGWNADWRRHMEKAERLLGTSDAVVIMRFMRTHFGRKLREACGRSDRPWIFCWGGAAKAQARAVIEAARLAAKKVRQN